jgi:hypothetical protein
MEIKGLEITDQHPEYKTKIVVDILVDGGKIYLKPRGYGEHNTETYHGYPIQLDIWEGRLRVIVADDINKEDLMIIDLENAREDNRTE